MKAPMAVTATDQARAQRAREVENALASVRMEGLEPSDDAKAIFQRYVDGDLTAEEMGRAIDQILDTQYGPVRLPGNKCPFTQEVGPNAQGWPVAIQQKPQVFSQELLGALKNDHEAQERTPKDGVFRRMTQQLP